jgi:hypothetical protein
MLVYPDNSQPLCQAEWLGINHVIRIYGERQPIWGLPARSKQIDTRVQTAISLAMAAYMRLAGEEQMDVTKVQTVISSATAAYMRLAG